MKFSLIISFLFFSLKIFGQSEFPKLNCEEFDYTTDSNTTINLRFLSPESYAEYDKDSIQKEKPKIEEDIELNKIFQKKYPNKITEHCIDSKYFSQVDGIANVKFCDSKLKIKLVGKKHNFYIFKVDAFEIDNYLLFDMNSEVIYDTNNYPQILENGKIVIDAGYEYCGYNVINYYFFENNDLNYFKFRVSTGYKLQNIKLFKAFNSKPRVVGDFIRYDYKEVSNKEGFGKKYDFDKEKYCRKLVMIFKN